MEFFKQVAKGFNEWWMYILGFLGLMIGYFVGQAPLTAAMFYAVDKYNLGTTVLKEFEKTNNFELLHISRNLGFLMMILPFIFGLLGLFQALKIHKKQMMDIITVRRPFDMKRFLYGFALWMVMTFIAEIITFLISPDDYSIDFRLGSFIVLAIICILLLPIQTSLEEIFFRGYLAQGFYKMTKSPLAAIIISSVLFSMVHSMNPEVQKFGFLPMQFYYIGAGLFLALIAFMDNGLELSIGIHTATNLFGALFVKYEGSVLQTDAIWSVKTTDAWAMSFVFYTAAAIFYYFASRKYNWPSDMTTIKAMLTGEMNNMEMENKIEIQDHLIK
jgi:uncharacterized protein